MTPTEEQREILKAIRESNKSLLINAFAGCGKTTTLEMLAKELPRKSSLAIAFNVKIKKELERRFPEYFTVMTFNGLGHRAWARTVRGNLTLDDKKLGKLVTQELKKSNMEDIEDAWQLVRELVSKAQSRGLTPSETRPGWIEDTEDNWKEIAEDNWLQVDDSIVEVARRVLRASVMKAHEGIISFDDQLYMPLFFGGQWPRFDIVLVDEAQDLSPLNHEQVRRVAGFGGRLIVCGDRLQAIYGFRGADTSSIEKLKALRTEWIELPLATTFRCPKEIVKRQQNHAAGFKAFDTAPEGEFNELGSIAEQWKSNPPTEKDFNWSLDDLPNGDIAILCRNNAPLLSIAFKILKKGFGVQMLGRDLGKGLLSIIHKLSGKSNDLNYFKSQLEEWKTTEYSKALINDDEKKAERIEDQYSCIMAVIESAEIKSIQELKKKLEDLFARENGRFTLSTGHRAKGLEWNTVVHLDPFRIPSKLARKNPKAMEQEMNLRYVIETRTKQTLIEANLEDFADD